MKKKIYILFLLIITILLFNYYSNISNNDKNDKNKDKTIGGNNKDEDKIVLKKEDAIYYEINDVFNSEECNYIINLAKPHLVRSTVMSNEKSVDNARTSQQTWIYDNDPLIKKCNKKIHDIVNKYSNTKIPYKNTEPLQVVKYKEGQEYKPHYDVCNPYDCESYNCKKDIIKICKEDEIEKGLRYATALIYLNDDYGGGETIFPNIDIKIEPKKGKLLLFYSLNPDKTTITNSKHGGSPVTKNYKWICTKWYRLKKN